MCSGDVEGSGFEGRRSRADGQGVGSSHEALPGARRLASTSPTIRCVLTSTPWARRASSRCPKSIPAMRPRLPPAREPSTRRFPRASSSGSPAWCPTSPSASPKMVTPWQSSPWRTWKARPRWWSSPRPTRRRRAISTARPIPNRSGVVRCVHPRPRQARALRPRRPDHRPGDLAAGAQRGDQPPQGLRDHGSKLAF